MVVMHEVCDNRIISKVLYSLRSPDLSYSKLTLGKPKGKSVKISLTLPKLSIPYEYITASVQRVNNKM
jgi:hypothetical protein